MSAFTEARNRLYGSLLKKATENPEPQAAPVPVQHSNSFFSRINGANKTGVIIFVAVCVAAYFLFKGGKATVKV